MNSLSRIRHNFDKTLATIYDAGEIQVLFLMAVEEVLGWSRTEYALHKNAKLEPAVHQRFENILEKLQQQVPIQHILGKAPFYGLTLTITSHTLIPRPETEELVDTIIRRHQKQIPLKILDVGTGSGCIAISLAKHLQPAEVHAIDISQNALEVARQNAKDVGVNIYFKPVDIIQWEDFFTASDSFDIIVSNPPYIRHSERQHMSKNVLDFEPHNALFVEDSNPLLFYDRISDFALHHLTPTGSLYFEINQYLGSETRILIEKKGFQQVELIQDINGVDRMVIGRKNNV